MDIPALLIRASRAGLQIDLRADAIVIRGPKAAASIVEEIGCHVDEVAALIEADAAAERGALCDRCGELPSPRLPIPTYWGDQLCPTCCAEVVAEHDMHQSWPPPPSWLLRPADWVGSGDDSS